MINLSNALIQITDIPLSLYIFYYLDYANLIVPTPMAPDISLNIHGSLKKRVAPPPPPGGNSVTSGLPSSHYGTLPSSATLATSTHSRTTSEPILAGHTLHTLPHTLNTLNSQHHKRSPSGDSSTGHGTFDK